MGRFSPGAISKHGSLLWIAAIYAIAAGVAVATGWMLATLGQHPLIVAGGADLAATIVVFCFSVLLDNSSCYDPYWSVAPPALTAYYWLGLGQDRWRRPLQTALISALVLTWAARLTFNWIRRWNGLHDEDWRYRQIRSNSGRAYWLVSLLGIHLMPTALVFAGCLPLYAALAGGTAAFGLLDILASAVTAGAIIIESVADKQLHRFIASGPAAGQVLTSGLWSRCRHPNYIGELLFWWGLSLFAPGWPMSGAAAITVLFLTVSIPMMDRRMRDRLHSPNALK